MTSNGKKKNYAGLQRKNANATNSFIPNDSFLRHGRSQSGRKSSAGSTRAPPRHSDPLDLCRFFVLCNMHAAALGCTSTLFSFSFFVAGRQGKAEEAGRQRESIKKVRKTGVVVCTEGTGKAKINVKKLSLFPFAYKRNIRVSIKKKKKTLGNMFSWVPNDLSFLVDLSVRQGQSGGGFKSRKELERTSISELVWTQFALKMYFKSTSKEPWLCSRRK